MVKNNIYIVIILAISFTGLCMFFIYKIVYFPRNIISIKNNTNEIIHGEVIFNGNYITTVKIENLKSGNIENIPIQKYFEGSIRFKVYQEDILIEKYISGYYESAFNEYFEVVISEKNGKMQIKIIGESD